MKALFHTTGINGIETIFTVCFLFWLSVLYLLLLKSFFCLLFLYRKIYQSSITASESNSLYFFWRYLLLNYFTFIFFLVSTPVRFSSHRLSEALDKVDPSLVLEATASPRPQAIAAPAAPKCAPIPTVTSAVCPPRSTQNRSHLTELMTFRDVPTPFSPHRASPTALSGPQCVILPQCSQTSPPPRPALDLRARQASASGLRPGFLPSPDAPQALLFASFPASARECPQRGPPGSPLAGALPLTPCHVSHSPLCARCPPVSRTRFTCCEALPWPYSLLLEEPRRVPKNSERASELSSTWCSVFSTPESSGPCGDFARRAVSASPAPLPLL